MKHFIMAFVVFTQGCVMSPNATAPVVTKYVAPPAPVANDRCPPLPTLPPGATRFEARLLNEVVRELYVQCAESKR